MAEHESPLTVGELAQLTGLLLGALVLFILIAVDIRKTVKKGNFWVPGCALALSALTIQLMNFIEDRSALLNQALLDQYSNSNLNCTQYKNYIDAQNFNCTLVAKVQWTLFDQNSKPLMVVNNNLFDKPDDKVKNEVLTDILFMVHCSRVMLCVLIAFLLPGMARPGYEQKWSTIAALGFTLFIHIFSELLSVRRKSGMSPIDLVSSFFYFTIPYHLNDVWIIVYGAIISLSLIWLLQLLICATIANKGIRNITLQKIPLILQNPGENSLQALEDQVLKSWIVFRACFPESIIASSALASSAALAVTVCLLLSILGWIIHGPFTRIHAGLGFWLKFIITIVEILFSLIGGAIIGWRWLASVAYYGRWRKKEEKWHNCFRVEDYWTMHILELQKQLHDDNDKIVVRQEKSQKVQGLLLQCAFWLLQSVIWLQCLVVFFSKVYWFLSELAFTNKLLHKVATLILSKHLRKVEKEFEEYEALLHNMYILSETPRSVFFTNRKSIKQAKGFMKKGNMDGEKCDALIPFLRNHRRAEPCAGISCLQPGKEHDQTGLKFLWKRDPDSMEMYLICPSKQSWKLTAVSLINIISRLGGDLCLTDGCSCGGDYFKVYQEAREFMDLVEETGPETDRLLSKAADGEFMALRDHISGQNGKRSAFTTLEEASAAIKGLAEELKWELAKEAKKITEETKRGANETDTPVDWEKLAARATLYNICISMDCSSGDLMELKMKLQSTLAHIIRVCIEKVGIALVENSRKWAQQMEERKLLKAVYIAGKFKGLMERLDLNLRITPTTEESGWLVNVFSVPKTVESAAMVEVVVPGY